MLLFSLISFSQFLAQLKIMDYSLLVGIHDVDRAEQEEMEVEDRAEDEECENDGLGGNPISSYGTPPDSPGNLLNYPRFFGPGEFDPSVDVYAMKSHESEYHGVLPGRRSGRAVEVSCALAGLNGVEELSTERERERDTVPGVSPLLCSPSLWMV